MRKQSFFAGSGSRLETKQFITEVAMQMQPTAFSQGEQIIALRCRWTLCTPRSSFLVPPISFPLPPSPFLLPASSILLLLPGKDKDLPQTKR